MVTHLSHFLRTTREFTQPTTMTQKNNISAHDRALRPRISLQGALCGLLLLLTASASAFSSKRTLDLRRSSTMFYTRSSSAFRGSNPENENARSRRFFRKGGQSLLNRLEYRDGDDNDSSERRQENETFVQTRWWPFTAISRETVDKESEKVDEYLEFLDRRYHRLHDDEEQQQQPKFSAWKWLMQGAEGEDTMLTAEEKQQQQEDALEVLGLAGLASQRLLQKYGKAQPEQRLEEAPIESISTEVEAVAVPQDGLKMALSLLAAKLSPFWRRLAIQRKILLRYQTVKFRAATAVLLNSVAVGPAKATKALWKLGGGKKNVGWTLTVMGALAYYLLRPLVQTIIREGAAARRA